MGVAQGGRHSRHARSNEHDLLPNPSKPTRLDRASNPPHPSQKGRHFTPPKKQTLRQNNVLRPRPPPRSRTRTRTRQTASLTPLPKSRRKTFALNHLFEDENEQEDEEGNAPPQTSKIQRPPAGPPPTPSQPGVERSVTPEPVPRASKAEGPTAALPPFIPPFSSRNRRPSGHPDPMHRPRRSVNLPDGPCTANPSMCLIY